MIWLWGIWAIYTSVRLKEAYDDQVMMKNITDNPVVWQAALDVAFRRTEK